MDTRILKHDRPTIGILAGRSILQGVAPDHYRTSVIGGIQLAARNRKCHLLMSWGIRLKAENNRFFAAWPVVSPESDFLPVGPWNTDGLIVFTPLEDKNQSLYIQQLIAKGFPVLFIGTGENGPTISANNHMGIYQAVKHLAQHGHRRIAFLAGLPTDEGDSKTRLVAYQSAVGECNLEIDSKLVIWGLHDYTEGNKVMQKFLKSGIKYSAVLASNDNSAIGAMQAIREAGKKIPKDIAIIGFDDIPDAIVQMPPLTSVHVPLNQIGEQALLMMADQITGQSPLESIQIPTRLIQRQSCGCMPDAVASTHIESSLKKHVLAHESDKPDIQKMLEYLTSAMLSALPAELRFPGGEKFLQACMILVESFFKSLKEKKRTYFETALIEMTQSMEILNSDTDYWQEMFSILRREMMILPLSWKQNKTRQLAEDMLHQGRAIIAESIQRQDRRHHYVQEVNVRAFNSVTSQLSVAVSDEQIVELLNKYLPGIGIRHARIMLFEPEQEDSVAWSAIAGLKDGSPNRRFRSREFPPPWLYEPNELLNLILLPLVFQNEVFGYSVFDAVEMESCATLARHIAATIKVSRLHTQVVELSLTDPLTGLRNRRYLDFFLANEIVRGNRFGHALSIILVDIDHFKDYNDQFGHLAGDEALRKVANCLTNGRRATDVVFRVGGEEFVIILPETVITGALICAEKLRVGVASRSDLERPITISLGVAVLNQGLYEPNALLKQVDQALYESKRNGRNRISVYQK